MMEKMYSHLFDRHSTYLYRNTTKYHPRELNRSQKREKKQRKNLFQMNKYVRSIIFILNCTFLDPFLLICFDLIKWFS